MNKKWEIDKPSEEEIKKIQEQYKINHLLAKILVNRRIIKEEEIRLFLNPTRKDFYNPYLMPDMEKAGRNLQRICEMKQKTR